MKKDIIIPLDYEKIIKPDVVVFCETKQENDQLMMWAHSKEFMWSSGQTYSEKSYFPEYPYTDIYKGTCYSDQTITNDLIIITYKEAIKYETFSVINFNDAEHLVGRFVECSDGCCVLEDEWTCEEKLTSIRQSDEPFAIFENETFTFYEFIRTIPKTYEDLLVDKALIEALEMSIAQYLGWSKEKCYEKLEGKDLSKSCFLCDKSINWGDDDFKRCVTSFKTVTEKLTKLVESQI